MIGPNVQGRVTGNVQFPDNPSLQTVPDPDAASPTPAVAPATEVTPAANPPAASPPSGPTPAAPVPDTPANPPPANPTPAAPVPAAEQPPAQTAPGADNGPASNGALWDAANAQSAHLTPEQAAKMAPYPKPPQSAGSPGAALYPCLAPACACQSPAQANTALTPSN